MKILMRVITLVSVLLLNSYANEKVSLQLQWLHQFQFAGFYIAKEMGFYEQAGLDVTLKEYNASINVIDEVLQKKSEYGLARSSLLLSRAEGKPVIALGAIFQHSPSVLITTNSKVHSPKDLKNKNIMITTDQASGASIAAMLLSQGVMLNEISIEPHSFNLQDLIDKKTDAMACYLSNEPFFLEKGGVSYTVFDPKDYGFDFYGDILFTSEEQLKKYPQRTKAFYEASIKGWHWAFEHIEETAQIIYEKYNSQHKSLESLIFEGKALEKLTYDHNKKIGFMHRAQIEKIADIYHLTGLMKESVDLSKFIDPLGFNKKPLHIGVLAKRGDQKALDRWQPLADYLNRVLEHYHVDIVPLHFDAIQEAIKGKEIDFLLTNTMNYVQLENQYGVSRIVTMKNRGLDKDRAYNYFGGVIFTKKESDINSLEDVRGRKFAAVNEYSFGGWVMVYELLQDSGISRDDIALKFYNTHDEVVKAVLDGRADVGTVRSDTIEHIYVEEELNVSKIKVFHQQEYKDFPYLVSTKLYPEWPLAKLQHVKESIAIEMMKALISMPKDCPEAVASKIGGWTVPLDYSSVHTVLKKLHISPYEKVKFNLIDVLKRYAFWIYTLLFFMFIGLLQYRHVKIRNKELDEKVNERTRELYEANKRLKELAHKDSLTGIANHGYFLELSQQLFRIAKRNNSPLHVLSLDIDHFKLVNDTYGHHIGDIVLKIFCDKISSLLRSSDIFGRLGGEEFAICLQSTDHDGAAAFANRILKEIEALVYEDERGNRVTFTVSIGIAELKEHKNFEALLNDSDKALYRAKRGGRNQVVYI